MKVYFLFDVRGSVHLKRIFMYNQQDATLHKLFISVKCSTCFRRFLCPSSGAQNSIYNIGYPMLYIQFWAPDDGQRKTWNM